MAAERHSTYLDWFISLTKAITLSLTPEELLGLITRKIHEILGVDAATTRLLDASGKHLKLQAAYGLSEDYLNRGPIDAEEPIFMALKGDPNVIEDAVQDPRIDYRKLMET